MNPNDAGRVIAVVDKRITKHVKSEAQTETTWGEVCGISADGKYASAYLYGETENASEDFRIPGDLALSVGDKVKVAWNARGERWVYDVAIPSAFKKVTINPNTGEIATGDGTAAPTPLSEQFVSAEHTDHTRIRVTAEDDASPSSTLHGLQVGPDTGPNIAMDGNEMMGRDNGVASDLHLNADGGMVTINNNSGGGANQGLKVLNGGIRVGTNATPSSNVAVLIGADVELERTAADVLTLGAGDRLDNDAVAIVIRKTSTQSIGSAAWTKVISWTNTDKAGFGMSWNPYAGHEIRADVAGVYLVSVTARFGTTAGGWNRIVGFSISNGVTPTLAPAEWNRASFPVPGGTNNCRMAYSAVVNLDALDTIALFVYQDSGTSVFVDNCLLSAVRIGLD